jgi:light-regulated signal transduction histidine kinase (bacteriophytochrome)
MDKLIESLLHYSRLGRSDLAVQPTDLQEVLSEILDSLRITLEERGVEVRVPRPLPVVVCDKVRIGEVFENLIINAMKYNDKAEKWVEVGVMPPTRAEHAAAGSAEPWPVFYVRDNGIGIDGKHHAAIFRIFKRLHGREKFGGGVGAGLTIVQKIIERHRGRIWLESTPGQGTTFYFTIPQEA